MSDKPTRPIRLTKQRAEALLFIFDRGAADAEAALRRAIRYIPDADDAEGLKARDRELAAARDAARIIRHRYLGDEAPTTTTPTLF